VSVSGLFNLPGLDSGENSRVQSGRTSGPTTEKGQPGCDSRQPERHACTGAAYFTGAHTGPQFEVSQLGLDFEMLLDLILHNEMGFIII
jgi:hypothetical protein